MVKHISKILEEFFEGEWNGVSKKKFKDGKKTLSELNFDNQDDLSVLKDGKEVPLTYLRERTQCTKDKDVSKTEHKNKSEKPHDNE